jgi:hypothetical protein
MKPVRILTQKPPKRNLTSFFFSMVTQGFPHSSSPSFVVAISDRLLLPLIIVTVCLSYCSRCRSCRLLPFTWISLVFTGCCHFAVVISELKIGWFCYHVNLKKNILGAKLSISYGKLCMYVVTVKICLEGRLMYIIWQIFDTYEPPPTITSNY